MYITLSLYYEHKACVYVTLHTHVIVTLPLLWQHIILVTNSNQPQAMTTCITLSLYYEHKALCMCAHKTHHHLLHLLYVKLGSIERVHTWDFQSISCSSVDLFPGYLDKCLLVEAMLLTIITSCCICNKKAIKM